MKVYIVHELIDEMASVVAVYATVDKAVVLAKSIAVNNRLEVATHIEPSDSIIVEFADYNYDTVVWVEETEVIE